MIDYSILIPASTDDPAILNNFRNTYTHHNGQNSFAVEPIVYGAEEKVTCYEAKVIFTRNILRQIKSEYVIALDGFDTIANKPLDEGVFRAFEENPELEFIFGAEVNCYPYPEFADTFDKHSKTRLKYVNGGLVVAKTEPYLALLEKQITLDRTPEGRIEPHRKDIFNGCDQRIFTLAYKSSLDKEDNKIIIDSEAKIGIQMFLLEKDQDYVLDENKQLTFLETGNIPYFVHFNGAALKQMPHFGLEYGK